VECGGGGISGGCRFTTGYYSVQTCRLIQIVCVYINTCRTDVLHGRGLMFSNKIEFHTNFNPLSSSARLMYNSAPMKWLTPPALPKNQASGGGE